MVRDPTWNAGEETVLRCPPLSTEGEEFCSCVLRPLVRRGGTDLRPRMVEQVFVQVWRLKDDGPQGGYVCAPLHCNPFCLN